jgi:NodT family efflux transporter outer membrane factor (OMF) lipoprotein
VAYLYILLRTLERRLDIAGQNMESQRETLAIVEARLRAGASSERDVEQARTVLYSTEATIPALQIQLEQYRHGLSVLLGLPPSDLSAFLGETSAIPVAPIEVAVGIPADLLRRRPDIRSAEYQAMAQGAQIGVARADLFPSFSITGSFGFLSTDIERSGLGNLFDWGSRTYTAGSGFQWNLFNYGRIVNNVRLQDARFQELLISYQNSVLRAQQEVEDGLSGFLRSREQAESLARSAEAARRSLDLAGAQYRGGVVDFTTVLTSQQALLSQQDNLASTMGEISRSVVRVYRALGGGWEVRDGTDLIPPEVREVMAKRTNWGDLLSPAAYMPIPDERKHVIRKPDW